MWLSHVTFHSVFQPHTGFLGREDWRQRCWQNRDWPLWESCAQDCGKLRRFGNRRGIFTSFISFVHKLDLSSLSQDQDIFLGGKGVTLVGQVNLRHLITFYFILYKICILQALRVLRLPETEGKQSSENADCSFYDSH